MNLFDTALSWLDRGIAVIPIGYRSKRPNTRFLHNGEWKRYQNKLPCRGEVESWFDSRFTNIAIVTGWQNLAIVDFDNLAAYQLWKQTTPPTLQGTFTIGTGRGFHHYYFVDDFPAYTMKWFGGEIKATGYCIIPSSIHPSGRPYVVANDAPIMRIESIDDIFPHGLFDDPPLPTRPIVFDPLAISSDLSCAEINQRVRLTSFFSQLRESGNGWYTVMCPLHDDHHASGWIDDRRNRYGCHMCQNGSLSVLDFYMRLNQCDLITAMRELS